jgi:hypothetical protein
LDGKRRRMSCVAAANVNWLNAAAAAIVSARREIERESERERESQRERKRVSARRVR